jgi:hypothetical protein
MRMIHYEARLKQLKDIYKREVRSKELVGWASEYGLDAMGDETDARASSNMMSTT